MRLAKRRGWVRLGVVISLAWLFGVLLYAATDFHNTRSDLAAYVEKQGVEKHEQRGKYVLILDRPTFFSDCFALPKEVSCSLRLKNVALLGLGPIAIGWILVVVIAKALLWILAGFRNDAREPAAAPPTPETPAAHAPRVKRRWDWKSDFRSLFLGFVGALLVVAAIVTVFNSAVGIKVEGRFIVAIAVVSGIFAGIYVQKRHRGLWIMLGTVLGAAVMYVALLAGRIIHVVLR